MSIPVFEAIKKRKRTPKIYGLHTFGYSGSPISPSGPFRENILAFLRECAEPEEYNVDGMNIWCTFLLHETRGFLVPLYTIEESVEYSLSPFCDHCRCTGWSHHFVSKRKYHIIIPVDDDWNRPLDDHTFDQQTHLLHGLIHSNGFGHLLCINGIEGGSKYLYGREIMDLWDRICTNLKVRKITVEDQSKKRTMDLRLLHGISYGHSWFGRWGYKFCHGSFGATEYKYEIAIQVLSNLEIDSFIQDFSLSHQHRTIKQIACYYRDLSETKLLTMRDLLRFMLTRKFQAPVQKKQTTTTTTTNSYESSTRKVTQSKVVAKENSHLKYRKFENMAANDSRWPARRLEFAANVIVDALKEKKAFNKFKNCSMTRQEARDAARLHIGDTGLIDYVLKSLNNVIVGGQIVRRAVNPSTRVLEFSIHEVENGSGSGSGTGTIREDEGELAVISPKPASEKVTPAGEDVYEDVIYIYNNVLIGNHESKLVQLAIRTVLDSKHFVKEWPFLDPPDNLLRFVCRVNPFPGELEKTQIQFPKVMGEYITLPLHATIGILKAAVEMSMRKTYCAMEKLVIRSVKTMEEMEDEEVLFGLVQSGSEISLWGEGIDWEGELKHEGGAENWVVKCKCGTRDDDGERMVACDVCEVWQHTRCSGIGETEAVPPLFVCASCCASLMPTINQPQPSFDLDFLGTQLLISNGDGDHGDDDKRLVNTLFS
ncbi:PHD finger protein MALE MEIOCYTE DEATH 1 [Impatiens glandulifera]|uniref:PHD finger protein MALE MEIOCYTE DEATH 1 n=1 Tax=Impatiens glandulifera TaxID=253017 RepID=UPI001FB15780|nr:PHD finger protein MALE MEIOCYTE DEATH 1 [Impatiens glandulifera]